jgi:hypothetical protein
MIFTTSSDNFPNSCKELVFITDIVFTVNRKYIKFSKMQRYVMLGVPWAAARWQNNYENAGIPQTTTRCQET